MGGVVELHCSRINLERGRCSAPGILLEAEENIKMVRENSKIAQSRQHNYADTRRRELSFEVGDHVYLKMSPMRGVRRFRVKGKLAP
jgi:allantoicase